MNILRIKGYPTNETMTRQCMPLFRFKQNEVTTNIYLELDQVHYQDGRTRGISHIRNIYFELCDYSLDQSFEALSAVASVIKVVQSNKLARGQNTFEMEAIPGGRVFVYFKKHERRDGSYLYELGYRKREGDEVRSHHFQTLHIGQLYNLNNAINRAMSWASPLPLPQSTFD